MVAYLPSMKKPYPKHFENFCSLLHEEQSLRTFMAYLTTDVYVPVKIYIAPKQAYYLNQTVRNKFIIVISA